MATLISVIRTLTMHQIYWLIKSKATLRKFKFYFPIQIFKSKLGIPSLNFKLFLKSWVGNYVQIEVLGTSFIKIWSPKKKFYQILFKFKPRTFSEFSFKIHFKSE
jgi:hypothetical protein